MSGKYKTKHTAKYLKRGKKMAAQRAKKSTKNKATRRQASRTKTVVANIGHTTGRNLNTRVKALEAGSKKHWDTVSNNAEDVNETGTTLNAPHNSYTTLLSIQGPLCDAEAGDPTGILQDSEQRMSDTVYAKSVRIRGRIRGVRLNPTIAPVTATEILDNAGLMNYRQRCGGRVWISILQDKRPSLVGANGVSVVNPLPTDTGETPLVSCYEVNGLGTYGPANALRSYNSSRFKIIHQECHNLTYNNNEKYFDITVNINKYLKFVAPRPIGPGGDAPANPPADPYNYNLLVYVSCLTTSLAPPWTTADPATLDILVPPALDKKTSRLYFIDN